MPDSVICPECEESVCKCLEEKEEELCLEDDSFMDHISGTAKLNAACPGDYSWELCGVSYWIEVTVEQMLLILERDSSQSMLDSRLLSDELLDVPGVDIVEYSGHFGAGISLYIIENEFESDGRKQVEDRITDYLGDDWVGS